MKKMENECVDCGLPCFNSCPNRNVARYYCDRCEEETTLYDYYGEEICKDCLLKEFNIIEGSEW